MRISIKIYSAIYILLLVAAIGGVFLLNYLLFLGEGYEVVLWLIIPFYPMVYMTWDRFSGFGLLLRCMISSVFLSLWFFIATYTVYFLLLNNFGA